ncbi:NAD(P)-binding protein [Violaceomyces palustris]|uniref:NAD(P)-binding protein n=1 Tax=Violaceomyces palustris TaxID=1673888 RepID=A0ACD0P6S2_9BASI|nr:NAD(P)-binding protein [Violaceomyces palustris]
MATIKQVTQKNEGADCSNRRALVAGGTQGIGAGIALRFALSGASVWIIGRNEAKASDVLNTLCQASAEAARRRGLDPGVAGESGKSMHEFFKADLSLTSEVKRVAGEVAEKAGKGGIDWLIETQGGPPNGTLEQTTEGTESHYAVQCLSRIGLASLLAEKAIIKSAICMVAAPGQGGKGPIDLDDLDFLNAQRKGKWWGGVFGILKAGARDSFVLDTAAQCLAEKHPNISVSHLFPGFVATDAPKNQGFAWPIVQLGKIFGPIFGTRPGPGGYAEIPFYLLTHPEGQSYLETGSANLLGPNLKKNQISPCVSDKQVRESLYSRVISWFN